MGSIPAWDGMSAEGLRRGARPHVLECTSPGWGRQNGLSEWSLHVLPMPPGGFLHTGTPFTKTCNFLVASVVPPLIREGRLFGGRGTGWNSVILPRAMSSW